MKKGKEGGRADPSQTDHRESEETHGRKSRITRKGTQTEERFEKENENGMY
jgi:hypothetical protein